MAKRLVGEAGATCGLGWRGGLRPRRRSRFLSTLVGAAALIAASTQLSLARADAYTPPPIGHVWVIVLENSSFQDHANGSTLNPSMAGDSPYLTKVLAKQGNLLTQYWAIGHNSLDDYVAMVSGQSPTPGTQSDELFCGNGGDIPDVSPMDPHGQIIGQGCIYPAKVKTLFDQLSVHGVTWKAYMEELGNSTARDGGCRHGPSAAVGNTDAYVRKHDPTQYFHSILDDKDFCDAHDTSLYPLARDLHSVRTTPNFSFITPTIIHDGHEGFYGSNADLFLHQYVPMIMSSPAYRQNGMIIVTWDEAESIVGFSAGQTVGACCNEIPGPNSPMPGISGPGGGRTGAVVLSPFVKPGTVDNPPGPPPDACTPVVCSGPGYYNHYSFLRSMEDLFGLDTGGDDGHGHLGFAGSYGPDYPGPGAFGPDVYNNWDGASGATQPSPSGGPTGPRRADGSATWQHPLPQGNDLRGVSCPTAGGCLAVGDAGTIVATTDGGDHWSGRNSGTVSNLNGISCASATSCVAVGDGGTVLTSADGGATWSSGSSSSGVALNGVSCVTASICIAVGDGGTILRSEDSGSSWTSQSSGTDEPLYGAACPDSSDCYAVGRSGVVLATHDGSRWSAGSAGTTERFHAISCPTANTCLAAGDTATTVRTTNGGASWTQAHGRSPSDTFAAASCPSESACVLVGRHDPSGAIPATGIGASIEATSDGGSTYTLQSPQSHNPLFGVSCPSATTCLAVGARGTILRTTDGGASPWSSQIGGGPDSDLSRVICWSFEMCGFEGMTSLNGVAFTDARSGLAVGSYDTVMATTNGGATWVTQKSGAPAPPTPSGAPPLSPPGLNAVSCPASGRCVTVGDLGSVEVTADGGSTWSNQNAGIGNDLLGVSCPTSTTCYAVGSNGTVLRTTNVGITWAKQKSGTAGLLSAVDCPSSSSCVAVGGSGSVLTTTNSGATWSWRTSGTFAYLDGVDCPTTKVCLAVGEGGTVLGSSDGGKTWAAKSSGVGDDLMSLSCASASSCLATGSVGTVISTADGGRSWSVQGTGTDRTLRAVSCTKAGGCFSAGDAAAILRVTPSATR